MQRTDGTPCFRLLANQPQGGLEFIKEAAPQSRHLLVVILCGCGRILLRLQSAVGISSQTAANSVYGVGAVHIPDFSALPRGEPAVGLCGPGRRDGFIFHHK